MEMHPVCVSLSHSSCLSSPIRSSVLTNASRSYSPSSAARLGLRDGGSAGVQASLKSEILNTWPEAQVGRILGDYGDERPWKHIARKAVQARLSGCIGTTSGRVDVIGRSSFTRTGKKGTLKPRMHPGLRLAVNDELKTREAALSDEVALPDAFSGLSPGGRQQDQDLNIEDLDDAELDELFEEYGEVVRGEEPRPTSSEVDDDADSLDFAVAMAEAANEVKGGDIRVLCVKPLVYWTRFFVIATGYSRPQVDAIGSRIRDLAEQRFKRTPRGDAKPNSWTLLDFGDVVVHIFFPKERAFYNLEEFYGNATLVELPFVSETREM